MGVLSATGESSFPTGLSVRWRTGWSGEERGGAEGGQEEFEVVFFAALKVHAQASSHSKHYRVFQRTGGWSRVWLARKH